MRQILILLALCPLLWGQTRHIDEYCTNEHCMIPKYVFCRDSTLDVAFHHVRACSIQAESKPLNFLHQPYLAMEFSSDTTTPFLIVNRPKYTLYDSSVTLEYSQEWCDNKFKTDLANTIGEFFKQAKGDSFKSWVRDPNPVWPVVESHTYKTIRIAPDSGLAAFYRWLTK